MKKLFFLGLALALISCSADDAETTESQIVLGIDHYKTTSFVFGLGLVGQEEGSNRALILPSVEGFDFQPGYRYSLQTNKITSKNDGTESTYDRYELIQVISQDTIPPDTRFTVPLARTVLGFGYQQYVSGSLDTGYEIQNRIPINCDRFCGELRTRLLSNQEITGEFQHDTNGGYVLVDLY